MNEIPDHSVDLVICDLPYGVTKNKWDCQLPLEELWKQYDRVCKDSAPIILFGQSLFSAKLILSNEKMFRYNLIWDKVLSTGFLNANRMPLRRHEEILIFYKKMPTYHPQKVGGVPSHSVGKALGKDSSALTNNNYGNFVRQQTDGEMKHPTSILRFQKPHPSITVHPTEKPVELIEWLIRSYSNDGDMVLDNCMGSGTTGVAAGNLNRGFIGIELDEGYFTIAQQRIGAAVNDIQNNLH